MNITRGTTWRAGTFWCGSNWRSRGTSHRHGVLSPLRRRPLTAAQQALVRLPGAAGRCGNWSHWGQAGQAGVGAVVVWAHHVGKIVGQQGNQWLIQSGNDGHVVRTRVLSIAGAIAIRWG